MTVQNLEKEFFSALQKHSEAKLLIMQNYIVPWMRKIVLGSRDKKCLIIDGFAGAGLYKNDQRIGSPLIILKEAMNFYDQAIARGWSKPKIFLLMIEGDKENYIQLKENVKLLCGLNLVDENEFYHIPSKPTIYVRCINDTFENGMSRILDDLGPRASLIPSFCFIDPFGFSHTPFSLISRYLENEKAEMLLNFIFEETNRFIKHKSEKIKNHISKLFGVGSVENLVKLIGDNQGELRKEIVTNYYSSQLINQTPLNYVLNFEIKKSGRTKLVLFFGTKSVEGIKTMKSSMWKIDDTGLYLYDDRSQTNDIQFEFFKEFEIEEKIFNLSQNLYNEFKGKTASVEDLEDYVVIKTIYPVENFFKNALKLLEKDKKIDVINRKRRNSYPNGCSVKFI